MAFDILFAQLSSQQQGRDYLGPGIWPNPVAVDGMTSLVQRIYKNLMTEPGEDEQDPEWGSGLRGSIMPIPGQKQKEANRAAGLVLQKCVTDLKEQNETDPSGRLRDLRLDSLEYDVNTTSWLLAVTVVTSQNEQTLNLSV